MERKIRININIKNWNLQHNSKLDGFRSVCAGYGRWLHSFCIVKIWRSEGFHGIFYFLALSPFATARRRPFRRFCCIADFHPSHTNTTHIQTHNGSSSGAPAKWVVIINGCARFIIINEIDLRLLKLAGAGRTLGLYVCMTPMACSAIRTDIVVINTFYIVADDISAVKPLWRYEVRARIAHSTLTSFNVYFLLIKHEISTSGRSHK